MVFAHIVTVQRPFSFSTVNRFSSLPRRADGFRLEMCKDFPRATSKPGPILPINNHDPDGGIADRVRPGLAMKLYGPDPTERCG